MLGVGLVGVASSEFALGSGLWKSAYDLNLLL